jgi:endonuclease-3
MTNGNNKMILEILEYHYKNTTTALIYNNNFELLIATMLSAQTTDTQVNKITKGLFSKYPTPQTMYLLTEGKLAEEIKGCGLYRNKAKNILATVKILIEDYAGEVPDNREALMSLPGVGRKTANVVLANAFGFPALGVDTHVFRVANRSGLVKAKTPLQVEEQLIAQLPREKWGEAHHWLIWHGRKVCRAKKPLCSDCVLKELCLFTVELEDNQK